MLLMQTVSTQCHRQHFS